LRLYNRILVVAAHPDDEILGCGGLLSLQSSLGASIRVIFIAEGSSCRYSCPSSDQAQNEIIHRNDCAHRSLSLLGVNDLRFFNFPCGRLDTLPIIDINKIIESQIRDFDPVLILSHSPDDTNNDHKLVSRSLSMATRPYSCQVSEILFFEVLSSSEWNFSTPFKPNVFFQLQEEQIDDKIQALLCYDTEIKEFPYPRSPEGIRTLAKLRGMQSGFTYAEAFSLYRSIV
tara:strand:- start:4633 stop:5319 length:687 start_codon:yes stop_codon:yes gene_type:complete